MKYISHNMDETTKIAEDFAKTLSPGSVVLARGEMGVGKTAFAKGLGRGLGIKREITSPTFNIMLVYPAKGLDFVHIDAYRLESPTAVKDFGLDETIGDPNTICYIEWDDYISEYIKPIKKNIYIVTLLYLSENERSIEIERLL